jgi:hypothetical protein
MVDPFRSSRRKLARAKQHIFDLEGQIKSFMERKPYTPCIEPDPERPDHLLHKFKLSESIPDSFEDIAADAVNNLRSALDQACYAIAIASGRQSPRHTAFPFAGSATELENAISGRCKDVPTDIHPMFRAFKPYKGGNDILWALNQICVGDKHKMLMPIGTVIGGVGTKIKATGYASTPSRPQWDRAKNEIVYFITNVHTINFEYDFEFYVTVAFDEIEIISGQSALGVLHNLVGIVEGILMALEAECKRLGFVK